MARELELGPVRASVTCSLFCSLVQMDIMTCSMRTLATVPRGFPKALHTPIWSLDWGQHASHECPLGRADSRPPYGNTQRPQAAYTTKEAAVCRHCTPGPHREKSRISFLFKAERYSTVCTYYVLLICSSVNGHLGCFHIWAFVNDTL